MDIILKAVLNKVAVWKQMYANHEATADEINDRNWHGMCVVLTDRISELEEINNQANTELQTVQREADSAHKRITTMEAQLEAVRLLPDIWRAKKSFQPDVSFVAQYCANELEAAIGEKK